jgi:glycosyltransferase involved in cell wall biosynthesis
LGEEAMKKVGIIHLTGNIGGASVSCYNLVQSLKQKYEVIVFCPPEPKDFTLLLEETGVKVVNFVKPLGGIYYYSGGPLSISPVFLKNVFNITKYKWNLLKQIEDENLNLIIVNSKVNAWISTITKKLEIPSICFVRETLQGGKYNIWNYINMLYLNKFDIVSFLSKYDLNQLELKNHTTVIPDYLNILDYAQNESREDVCKKFGVLPDSFNILYVGGMARIKGIDVIIKAMKYLQEYDIKLIIAGRPDFIYKKSNNPFMLLYNAFKKKYEKKINKEIDRYNLNSKIVKIGIQNNMANVYTLSDVVVFPANKPHQARPAFEAGIQKKPILIADFENIKEFIKDGKNGLYFKRRDPKSLAEKIISLINNSDKRIRLGESNFLHALEKHNKELIDERILKLIEKII